MEETNALSELGEWKDCIGYPIYQISSTGAFMNKRTLKILKHFRHKGSDNICVTLYRRGQPGEVLSVKLLLILNFGEDAVLPEVVYKNDKTTELGPPKPKKSNNSTKIASNEGHLDENGFCKFCGWNSAFPESHIIFSGGGESCKYIKGLCKKKQKPYGTFLVKADPLWDMI